LKAKTLREGQNSDKADAAWQLLLLLLLISVQ
jgi:hypothetical protein